MAIVTSINSKSVNVRLHDDGTVYGSFHCVASAEAIEQGFTGWLEVASSSGSTFTIFLPPTVAQAMKDAFDKAMAELSKEDAA